MNTEYQKYISPAVIAALVSVTLVCIAGAYNLYRGAKYPNGARPTITVNGKADVQVKPDIATVMFIIQESGATVKEVQAKVEKKTAPLLESLKGLSVADKDIRTLSYQVSPRYAYEPCPPTAAMVYCQPKQKLDGYDVSQTLSVKVRNLDNAGTVLELAGKHEITNVSGPSFEVDDMDKVRNDAKATAIADARAKAESLASSLGVSIDNLAYFNDDSGSFPSPMYSSRAEVAMDAMSGGQGKVSVPTGESKMTITVNVTYNLK